MHLLSGYSSTATSGTMYLQTGEGLGTAASGAMALSTGDTCDGVSGALSLRTGDADVGTSGAISLIVGTGSGTGGDVLVSAGSSTGEAMTGGAVTVGAGDGGASTVADTAGGEGGDITLVAGAGGEGPTSALGATGGDLSIDGGTGAGDSANGAVYVGLASGAVELGMRDHSKVITVNGLLSVNELQVGTSDHNTLTGFHSVLSSAIDPPSLYPSQVWYQDLAFPDVELGDMVLVSFSQTLGTGMLTSSIAGTNTVRIMVFNPGAGGLELDIAEGIFRMSVWQYSDA